MFVKLEYGTTGLECSIPDEELTKVLRIKSLPPLPDLGDSVAKALSAPIDTLPLAQLAQSKKTACLVICDITRPVPNSEVLPVVIGTLEGAGVPRSGITILIATGTHRPNEGDELRKLVGPEIARNIRCINHFCTDRESLVDFGTSPNGVPIQLNRVYVEAELKITLGMIEPHFMAGFAGGRKMVMPGVAGLDSIMAWHSPKFLEHPLATNGSVEGNPVHEEALAICKLCPPDFIVDVALNEQKRPWAVFAGHFEKAWLQGVEAVRATTQDSVPEAVDVVVTTCGGFPLDLTYYQTVKGMVGALPIVKEGGWIVIASACDEGIGNAHFKEALFGLDRIDNLVERMESGDWTPVADQWQIEELAKAARSAKIAMICNGISPDDCKRIFAEPFPTVEAALDHIRKDLGRPISVAAIPKGPYVIARVQN